MSYGRSLIAVVLLAVLTVPDMRAQQGLNMLSQSSVPNGPGGHAQAVSRMVHGIIGYTRWPSRPSPVRLCIAGTPAHATALSAQGGNLVVTRGGPALSGRDCDALYLGPLPAGARAALLGRMRSHPVLTIDEADPGCGAGAMFCLAVGRIEIGLSMNLDAVSRSGVRVDPRVLRLARPGGAR